MSDLKLKDLKKLRKEISEQIRAQAAAAKRSNRSPVRLGQTKSNEPALLVSPLNRKGAPTRVTREVAEVLLSEDWRDVLAKFSRGEDLDASLFESHDDEDDAEVDSDEETSDESSDNDD